MLGGTDAGDGSPAELNELQRGSPLLLFGHESGVDLTVFHHSKKRGEGNQVNVGAQQRKVFGHGFKDRREKI